MAGYILGDDDSHLCDPNNASLSLLNSLDMNKTFNFTLNISTTNPEVTTNNSKSKALLLENAHLTSNETPETGLSKLDLKTYYEDIKQSCPDLECSYSELFTDNKPKTQEYLQAFVAKRIQQIVDSFKRRKSLSCSNLPNLSSSNAAEQRIWDVGAHYSKNQMLNNEMFDLNHSKTSKLLNANNEGMLNRFTSGSVEVLNYTQSSNASKKCNNTKGTYLVDKACVMQKSFSFNCLHDTYNAEMLADIEMVFEDSIPSENEVDEMGLPVKKNSNINTPKKKNILDTSKTYQRILRASLGEPAEVTNSAKVPGTFIEQPGTSYAMRKSSSFGTFFDKNHSLLDEFKTNLEDSEPSMDEDEMGLPIRKVDCNNHRQNKSSELTQIINRYHSLLKTMGKLNEVIQDEMKPSYSAPKTTEPPILPDICDNQLKQNQGKISKGPMKAFMPLKNMTKKMGLKIMSPAKKKIEKKGEMRSKNSNLSHEIEGFENIPIASSTPNSGKSLQDDSINQHTYIFNEGRMTPVKKSSAPILNVSYTVSNPSETASKLKLKTNVTNTLSKNVDSSKSAAPKKIINRLSTMKPQTMQKSSLGRRPSSTASINAPLTSKATPQNQSNIRPSTSKLNSEFVNNLPASTVAKPQNKISSLNFLKSVNNPLRKKPIAVSKFTASSEKENKSRLKKF